MRLGNSSMEFPERSIAPHAAQIHPFKKLNILLIIGICAARLFGQDFLISSEAPEVGIIQPDQSSTMWLIGNENQRISIDSTGNLVFRHALENEAGSVVLERSVIAVSGIQFLQTATDLFLEIGFSDEPGVYIHNLYRYSPSAGTWETLSSLPTTEVLPFFYNGEILILPSSLGVFAFDASSDRELWMFHFNPGETLYYAKKATSLDMEKLRVSFEHTIGNTIHGSEIVLRMRTGELLEIIGF